MEGPLRETKGAGAPVLLQDFLCPCKEHNPGGPTPWQGVPVLCRATVSFGHPEVDALYLELLKDRLDGALRIFV